MRLLRGLVLALSILSLEVPVWGQSLVIAIPNKPNSSSVATFFKNKLTVTDPIGQQFVYVRRPELDTPDGKFEGWFCAEAGRYMRWPISGTGNLQVGMVMGGVLAWSPSLMQIVPAPGGAHLDVVSGGPMHIGSLAAGPNTIWTGRIDPDGRLQFFLGHGERWRYYPTEHPPGIFVPGAPLQLIAQPGETVPRVITVGANGRFLVVVDGRIIEEIPQPPGVKFLPGSHFSSIQSSAGHLLFVSDWKGKLWRFDVTGGTHQKIEDHPGVLQAGLPISAILGGRELFMTDRMGTIVVYSLDAMGVWHGPEAVATGFHSAGNVATWYHPNTTDIEAAAVDQQGRLQVLRQTGGVWSKNTLPGVKLPTGSHVTAFETPDGLSLTAVAADGRWLEFFESPGEWNSRVIATGFPPHAPLSFNKYGPMLFASDVTGRLISAIWTGTDWHAVVSVPADFGAGQYVVAPRLISRKTILNRNVDPVNVTLVNSTSEELIVRVLDARAAGQVQEIVLPPNGSSILRADRDSGGTLEEVYLVPGPNGPLQQVRQFPLPPRKFYDLAVYANRVTYQYIDRRKQKGPVPDFNETSLISLGTIPLPPGNSLKDGTRLDVYQIATSMRNPGASAILDPMRP